MPKEFSARLVWMAGLGLLCLLLIVGTGLWGLQNHLLPQATRLHPVRPENPLHEAEFESGQVRARIEGAGYERLRSYGWVDADKKIARIPIQRAMELLLLRHANSPGAQP